MRCYSWSLPVLYILDAACTPLMCLRVDDKAPAPPPAIVLPPAPAPPTPPPSPPGVAVAVASDEVYVVQSDAAFLTTASPAGVVKVCKVKAPPVTIFGKATGYGEDQTFSAKYVTVLKPLAKGTVTVTLYPTLDEANAQTVTLNVGGAPPGPGPPVPPTTPLTETLQIYFDKEPDIDKHASLAMLTNLYAGMSILAQTKTDIKTNADWAAWLKATVESPTTKLGTDKIVNIRKVIAAELTKAWGATTAPLAAADAAKEIKVIADALGGVK